MNEQSANFMSVFLSPVDVWLFRDGRPFDARSHHRAESLFPPHPSVVQGAVRSYELVRRGVDLSDKNAVFAAVGDANHPQSLRMRGPWIAQLDGHAIKRYFPLPADAWLEDNGRARPASEPQQMAKGIRSNAPTPMLIGLNDPSHKAEGGLWLEESELAAYFEYRHTGNSVRTICARDLFAQEPRPGVGINSAQKTAQDGALFEVEFIRPKEGVGLFIEIEGYSGWPQAGVLRLGGEGRAARFLQVQQPDPLATLNATVNVEQTRQTILPSRFKVYFATPACFNGGWQPTDVTWVSFFDGPVKLESAAIARYESLGGFDAAQNEHKPARRFVPAGSVYYFSVPEGTTAAMRSDLVNSAITDWGAPFGYGQVLIQEW